MIKLTSRLLQRKVAGIRIEGISAFKLDKNTVGVVGADAPGAWEAFVQKAQSLGSNEIFVNGFSGGCSLSGTLSQSLPEGQDQEFRAALDEGWNVTEDGSVYTFKTSLDALLSAKKVKETRPPGNTMKKIQINWPKLDEEEEDYD